MGNAVKIGWLADDPSYKGGAELAAEELIACAPEWAEIVLCPPHQVREDVDAYVIHNCVQYNAGIISRLDRKPVIKCVHDVWPEGDMHLKAWLLNHARVLLLSSPLHRQYVRGSVMTMIVPNAISLDRFRAARNGTRSGAIWLGRLEAGKGIDEALQWAEQNGHTLDFYGYGSLAHTFCEPGRYCGRLEPGQVPEVLGRYQTFVFLPTAVEPFSRTVVEAWAAGCELVVNNNIGAVWGLQNNPAALDRGGQMFWEIVEQCLS